MVLHRGFVPKGAGIKDGARFKHETGETSTNTTEWHPVAPASTHLALELNLDHLRTRREPTERLELKPESLAPRRFLCT